MWDYVSEELPALIGAEFAVDLERQSITGHSMGGHGALTLAMAHPGRYKSVSAFAPIANPTKSDWGRKQLGAYLGNDEAAWQKHDASVQMAEVGFDGPVLIDQGGADNFLDLLKPEALAQAMMARRQDGIFRMQKGYDHSYFFISTFMEDHVIFAAEALYA
jgi:S-formylglutathione hydrolase